MDEHTTPPVWQPPTEGTNKLNCEAAVLKNEKVGLGFVLRDAAGKVVLAGKTECVAAGSSTLIEALAIKHALQMVDQYGLQTDVIESDSKNCIDGLIGKLQPDMYCMVIYTSLYQGTGREGTMQPF